MIRCSTGHPESGAAFTRVNELQCGEPPYYVRSSCIAFDRLSAQSWCQSGRRSVGQMLGIPSEGPAVEERFQMSIGASLWYITLDQRSTSQILMLGRNGLCC